MGVISVDCDRCRQSVRCLSEEEHRRLTLFGWFQGRSPECNNQEPLYFRGIDGVIDHGTPRRAGEGAVRSASLPAPLSALRKKSAKDHKRSDDVHAHG